MCRKRLAKRFTLIELLLVVAIIMLLMATLLPLLQRAKQRSKQIACMSNLKQCAIAFTEYATDYKGYFPSLGSSYYYEHCYFNALTEPTTPSENGPAGTLVRSYLKSYKALYCPSNEWFLKTYSMCWTPIVHSLGSSTGGGYINISYGNGARAAEPWDQHGYLVAISPNDKLCDNIFNGNSNKAMLVDLAQSNNWTASGNELSAGELWTVKVVNHIQTDSSPFGANSVYFDAHATWTPKAKLQRKLRQYYGAQGCWWW